jgi:hypothetical protein
MAHLEYETRQQFIQSLTFTGKTIWDNYTDTLFLHPQRIVGVELAYSIMVVRQILVLFVLVRIQVGQQKREVAVKALLFFNKPKRSCAEKNNL